MAKKKSPAREAHAKLKAAASAYPEAHEDHPWGETVYKVNKKVFIFLGVDTEGLSLAVKLPDSGKMALMLPFASPTPYNLGKSGWVSAKFGPDDQVPTDMLLEWLDESYRAVAPKKLVKVLDAQGAVE